MYSFSKNFVLNIRLIELAQLFYRILHLESERLNKNKWD